jgi:hypothetical protein
MLAAVALDRLGVAQETPSQTPIMTTLYDLMAALNDASVPGEEELITVAVVDLCQTGRLRFLARPHTPVAIAA